MPDATLQVSMSVLSSMDSRKDPSVQLRIEDYTSGELLAQVDLTAGQWLALTNGTVRTLTGFVSPHLDRVGKQQRVRSFDVPREVTPYGLTREEQEAAARQWTSRWTTPGDDEVVEVRRTNRGWSVTLRSWVD